MFLHRSIPAALLAALAAAVPATAATLGDRTLERGDHGSDVVTLQRVLSLKGYSIGAPDGLFGRRTKVAVKSFQHRRGLVADGRVGPLTTRSLANTWKLRTASYYGPGLYGNRTACGFTLRRRTRGIAHRTLPCGTRVAVYLNGRIAIYPVIDRGPYKSGVTLDLTEAAARKLGIRTTTDVLVGW